jgi:hypothetical protein
MIKIKSVRTNSKEKYAESIDTVSGTLLFLRLRAKAAANHGGELNPILLFMRKPEPQKLLTS